MEFPFRRAQNEMAGPHMRHRTTESIRSNWEHGSHRLREISLRENSPFPMGRRVGWIGIV
jgi:hypothetical protein